MSEDPDFFVDPWLHKADKAVGLPEDAVFACAYFLDDILSSTLEAAFFRRAPERDELWVGLGFRVKENHPPVKMSWQEFVKNGDFNVGCACAMPENGPPPASCLSLLENLTCARIGFAGPGNFVSSGLIKKPDFSDLVARIDKELKENKAKAQSAESEIINTAKELGLNPEPTGTGTSQWQANCPGTNHFLLIGSESGTFGCGYCKRKGAAIDLIAFTNEREAGKKPAPVKTPDLSGPVTPLNIRKTLASCPEYVQAIYRSLINAWRSAGGTVQCKRTGRIYLKMKTKAHSKGQYAQLPRNFNIAVLAAPFGKKQANMQIGWNLGNFYLNCIPAKTALFEKIVASLPGFERKGTITYLWMSDNFHTEHLRLMQNAMISLKNAEQNTV